MTSFHTLLAATIMGANVLGTCVLGTNVLGTSVLGASLMPGASSLASEAASVGNDDHDKNHAKLSKADLAQLDAALDSRDDKLKARDRFRHPRETLALFGIKPGMTVADTLPGSWYGSILIPYLGAEGTYIPNQYTNSFYNRMRGKNYVNSAERTESFESRMATDAPKWGNPDAAPKIDSFRTNAAPARLHGTLDAWLFFRALHHLNKYDPGMLDSVALEAMRLVKPGGIVGIVQHRAAEDRPDDWARGFNGYLKQSRVIDAFTKAGFTLEVASEINANPKDQAGPGDRVWRLLPANRKASDEIKAIGESDRMTLLFRKPK